MNLEERIIERPLESMAVVFGADVAAEVLVGLAFRR